MIFKYLNKVLNLAKQKRETPLTILNNNNNNHNQVIYWKDTEQLTDSRKNQRIRPALRDDGESFQGTNSGHPKFLLSPAYSTQRRDLMLKFHDFF